MMENTTISEVIDKAIQREEEAYTFYMELFDQIEDQSAKDTLEWVAAEEKKHKQFLIDYREGKFGSKALRKSDVVHYNIAEYQEEPEIAKDMQREGVFLVASHREKRSHQFYMGIADMHPTGEVRDMLIRMANEELKHKEKMEYLYANTAFPQTAGG
ncbi:MAG: ferritin family protein [Deltaproteobacteria bacterium]|jgi:rubrerythrin|nr:ferritin family protein [Deltaproteobacteria bacterium]